MNKRTDKKLNEQTEERKKEMKLLPIKEMRMTCCLQNIKNDQCLSMKKNANKQKKHFIEISKYIIRFTITARVFAKVK